MGKLLINERIRLRSMEAEIDTPYLSQWEGDSDAWISSGVLNPIAASAIEAHIIRSSTALVDHGQMDLMIETILEGKPIGYVQLYDYDPINQRLGLGVYIAPSYRKQRYAYEAMTLLHNYAWRRMNCQMLYAQVIATNIPSRKLFESLGYELTATLRDWYKFNNRYHDLLYYQLWNR